MANLYIKGVQSELLKAVKLEAVSSDESVKSWVIKKLTEATDGFGQAEGSVRVGYDTNGLLVRAGGVPKDSKRDGADESEQVVVGAAKVEPEEVPPIPKENDGDSGRPSNVKRGDSGKRLTASEQLRKWREINQG